MLIEAACVGLWHGEGRRKFADLCRRCRVLRYSRFVIGRREGHSPARRARGGHAAIECAGADFAVLLLNQVQPPAPLRKGRIGVIVITWRGRRGRRRRARLAFDEQFAGQSAEPAHHRTSHQTGFNQVSGLLPARLIPCPGRGIPTRHGPVR